MQRVETGRLSLARLRAEEYSAEYSGPPFEPCLGSIGLSINIHMRKCACRPWTEAEMEPRK